MARFTNGWVKLHRSILDGDISENPFLLSLWVRLILMANWKETKTIRNGAQRILPVGSVLTSSRELAIKWDCDQKTISKWLRYLEKTERISLESSARGTIVTILNYKEYQIEQENESALSGALSPHCMEHSMEHQVRTEWSTESALHGDVLKKVRKKEPKKERIEESKKEELSKSENLSAQPDEQTQIEFETFPVGHSPPGGQVELLKKKDGKKVDTGPTWEAFEFAYRERYRADPVRNAMTNGQMFKFVKRIGHEESPAVVEFYLGHNDAFYVRNGHSVGLLLRDAEKLRTEWATGRRILSSQAREIERAQHNSDSWDLAAKLLNERAGAQK